MRWRLTTEQGVTLLVQNRAESHETQPNLSAAVGSPLLMRRGLETVWSIVQYVVESLGCEIIRSSLSRVDACIDLPSIPVAMFSDPFRENWFVTRAKASGLYSKPQQYGEYASGKRATGFYVGKHPLMLRVYDKIEETKRDDLKREILILHRWGNLPKAATRVELQLGRQKLKAFGVDTVEDWRSKRADILDQLLSTWFRLTEGPIDRNHADRTPTHPLWEMVQRKFVECYGEPVGCDLSPPPKLWIDGRQRVSAAIGIFKGLFARVGKEIRDNEQFVREVEFEVRSGLMDRDMAEEVRRKSLELGVEGLQ